MAIELLEGLVAAAFGAGAGGAVALGKDLRLADATLRMQHRHEERRKLRELQSRYKGRVLEAALDWDRRMSQIYEGAYRHLDPPDDKRLQESEYYYHSVVFRFLQLTAVARRFEAEAFYIDPGIAQREDFDLLRYAKAFLWVMIHAELSPADGQPGIDHFRSDAFRPLLDLAYSTPKTRSGRVLPETRSRDGELIFDLQRCMAMLRRAGELGREVEIGELLGFFDGVRPDDYEAGGRQRRRWDRLVALHLLVLAFVDECGYAWHRGYVEEQTARAVDMLLYPETLQTELDVWLPRLGLDGEPEIARMRGLLRAAADRTPGPTEAPGARAERVYEQVQRHRRARRQAPLDILQPPPAALAAV